MRKHSARAGFTFLELMIAAAVFIIAFTGLLATYIACFEENETAKNSNLALNRAQQIMEEIFRTNFASVYSAYNGYTFNMTTMPANSSLGVVAVNNSNSNLYNVNVGVCWRQKGNRIIGDCRDVGGALVPNSAPLDSPVQLQTLLAQR